MPWAMGRGPWAVGRHAEFTPDTPTPDAATPAFRHELRTTARRCHRRGGRRGARGADQPRAATIAGMERGRPVVYAPAKWALIMLVIRSLPRAIFNKMDI